MDYDNAGYVSERAKILFLTKSKIPKPHESQHCCFLLIIKPSEQQSNNTGAKVLYWDGVRLLVAKSGVP